MDLAKKFIPYILILILGFFTFKPLISNGFFPMHDNTQVARVYEMSKALSDGMFPVRWSQDLGFGYGYPIFNFYAPFTYYVGGVINLLGIDALLSTKIMMFMGIILAGFSMYLLAKEFFGRKAAILSSLLYLYAPYHAVNVYVRGDVAEFFAYGLLPLSFYGIYRVLKTQDFGWVVFTSISYSLLIISHNLTALMVTPFLLAFGLVVNYKKLKTLFLTLTSLILGFGLSAFYSLPALLEMKYTNVLSQIGGGADFRDHFACLYQLWSSPWGFGGSTRGCIDGISFMVGKYQILLFISALLLLIFYFIKNKLIKNDKTFWVILLFCSFALISTYLVLEASKPVWELIKPMEFFQYPWRFLIIIEFTLSFVSGALLWAFSKILDKKVNLVISLVLIILTIVLSAKFFLPQNTFDINAKDFTSENSLKWTTSKISSEYMPKNFVKPKSPTEIPSLKKLTNKNLSVLSSTQKTQELNLSIVAGTVDYLTIPIAYFPAWNAFIDNVKTGYEVSNRGIKLRINPGSHTITIKFLETPIEKLANLITFASIISLVAGIIYYKKRYD